MNERRIAHPVQSTNLADLLERVLDKGLVIAGDIKVLLADVELLSIKVRLVICSVEKALAMGINWWQTDPYLRGAAGSASLPEGGSPHNPSGSAEDGGIRNG